MGSPLSSPSLESVRRSSPPPAAGAGASRGLGFGDKVALPEARPLILRLRPALVLVFAALGVAVFDPIYAAATGEILEVVGVRLSVLAGALLAVAVVALVRELVREQRSGQA